jgi:hypothetical protein
VPKKREREEEFAGSVQTWSARYLFIYIFFGFRYIKTIWMREENIREGIGNIEG